MEYRIHELEGKRNQMTQLYKSGDKQKLQKYMDENKISFREMAFFGVLDMVMFSMMFSMLGMTMARFIQPQDMHQEVASGDWIWVMMEADLILISDFRHVIK